MTLTREEQWEILRSYLHRYSTQCGYENECRRVTFRWRYRKDIKDLYTIGLWKDQTPETVTVHDLKTCKLPETKDECHVLGRILVAWLEGDNEVKLPYASFFGYEDHDSWRPS